MFISIKLRNRKNQLKNSCKKRNFRILKKLLSHLKTMLLLIKDLHKTRKSPKISC